MVNLPNAFNWRVNFSSLVQMDLLQQNEKLKEIVSHMAAALVHIHTAFAEETEEFGFEGAASQGPWVDSTSWPYSMARDITNAIHKKYDLDTLSSNEDVRPLTEEEMQSIRQGLRYPVGVQLSEEDSSRIIEHLLQCTA